jgi:histidinol dehydrogenase
MLERLDLRGVIGDVRARLPRPAAAKDQPVAAVQAVLAGVKDRGDEAVREFTKKFDGVDIDDLQVPPGDVEAALGNISPLLREALEAARDNILAFHREQLHDDGKFQREGLEVREVTRPVDRAGVYVPGGLAPLISTVLMTALPARVAGVPEVVLCSPPGPDGRIDDGILAAAALAGVDEVYSVGGAQAIGAMAYGTQSIRAVDTIVGPGNIYVSIAKREVAGEVGVPSSFAGPSEVVVIADESVPPSYAAIDVIVQAEHGPDGLAWLVTWSEDVAERVTAEVERMVAESPRRKEIEATLDGGGYAVLVEDATRAIEVSNAIAPEHLELLCADAEALVPLVRHAGAVFVGPYAPASVGDYMAGPSHVLPTYGSARFAGALRVDDFLKQIHVVSVDEAGLARLAPHVAALAEAEGLAAHAESVRIRWPGH